jgi:putative membrane protein
MAGNSDENTLLARERTTLANERTRLANERNYLAWTRTGLASVGAGLAIIRFLTFRNINHQMTSQAIGGILVALGIFIFSISLLDYKKSSDKISVKNGYAGSLWTVCTISFTLITVSIILLFIAFRFTEVYLGDI